MNLWFRLLWLALRSRFRAPSAITETCVTPFRVWPSDLDLLFHMNNGRYLSIMDIGRTDWLIRSKLAPVFAREKMHPIVTRSGMRYRRSLELGQAFTVSAKLAGWNERDFFVVQRFMRGEQVMAEGMIQGRMMQRGAGSMPTDKTLALCGMAATISPIADANFERVWAAEFGEK
jgi:acyl-CoA thioesterase FadM